MFGKAETPIGLMEGIYQRAGEKNVDFVARVKREIPKLKEEEQRQLIIKEFEAIKSKCLTCKNAFWQQYIPDPMSKDPLDLFCKKKLELLKEIGWSIEPECNVNRWSRKVLNCSDYEERS